LRSLVMFAHFRFAVRSLVVVGFGGLCVWSGAGEKQPVTAEPAASLIRYDVPGGESLFALSLRAPAAGAVGAHDHVILVDTSASQTGAHRQQACDVLGSCL